MLGFNDMTGVRIDTSFWCYAQKLNIKRLEVDQKSASFFNIYNITER